MSPQITASGKSFAEVAACLVLDANKADAEARRLRACADMKVGGLSETEAEREVRLRRAAGTQARFAGRLLAMADSYRSGVAPTEASHQAWYRRESSRLG